MRMKTFYFIALPLVFPHIFRKLRNLKFHYEDMGFSFKIILGNLENLVNFNIFLILGIICLVRHNQKI